MINDYVKSLSEHLILGDVRTESRYIKSIGMMGNGFGKTIPQSCANKSEAEGVYHLLNSPLVSVERVLLGEQDRLFEQISRAQPALVVSIGDVTELDFSTKRASGQLGRLNSAKKTGFRLLNHLLCEGDGTPMGLFGQVYWNYAPSELGKRRQRQHLPISEKETGLYLDQWRELNEAFSDCTGTTFVHLFDRAGDVHELLQEQPNAHIHYVIRAKNDRKQAGIDESVQQLLDRTGGCGCFSLEAQTPLRTQKSRLKIESRKGEKAESRTANIEVSFAHATLRASNPSKNRPIRPFPVWVVRAREVDPPPEAEPIEWTLLTTFPVHSFKDALQVLEWYGLRWQIELFHFTLKQGAKVEQLQLQSPDALQNAIVMYSLLAVQVHRLRLLAEKKPDEAAASFGYSDTDFRVLVLWLRAQKAIPHDTPFDSLTVSQFALFISKLGGNHNRGKPGLKSLWVGLQEFNTIKQAFLLFNQIE